MIDGPEIALGSRSIGAQHATYVIAEIGVNHNGNLELAHKLIDLAAASGADAVKFQTYVTDDLILPQTRLAAYQAQSENIDDQAEMLRRYELPFTAFSELKSHCDRIGLDFISTAFDVASLEFVVSLRPVCLKWASGELTNKPMLHMASKFGLPVLLSTGMGSLDEIAAALYWLGAEASVVILQCVSDYPAAIEDQNLRVLPAMQAQFGCPVGFSDHTIGPYAALAARPLGMAVLEKHFTTDKSLPGPDHSASATPAEFKNLVGLLRQIEAGLGDGTKSPRPVEKDVKQVARKSLVYRLDLPGGHELTSGDLTAKRPGLGVGPDRYEEFLGRRLVNPVRRDQLVRNDDVN